MKNVAEKEKNVKYKVLYKKLEEYGKDSDVSISKSIIIFNTNVVTGMGINGLTDRVSKYKKRDCFHLLERFIKEEYNGKICILYGLRKKLVKHSIISNDERLKLLILRFKSLMIFPK